MLHEPPAAAQVTWHAPDGHMVDLLHDHRPAAEHLCRHTGSGFACNMHHEQLMEAAASDMHIQQTVVLVHRVVMARFWPE